MSIFRKPKKIQRRQFCADDDDEEGDGEPQAPPPPVISREKKENKPVKTKQLLSFADEEEEGEVFKVKKSKQSNRLAKRREKEKKKPQDDENNEHDNENSQENQENKANDKPKKITLEGLILSGREALAADGAGDLSDEEIEETEEHGFHRYRADSVRAALAAGTHIPDPALIHAARKTRQQARELGADYIPVKESIAPGSRLVREDGSGDEDEDGRIQVRGLEMPTDKPKRGTAVAAANEELDSEPDEWEEQQIKKAMPAIPDITGAGDMSVEVNPFALGTPAPQLQHEHLRPLVNSGQPLPTTAQELVDALRDRLEELQTERLESYKKCEELKERLMVANRVQESRSAKRSVLDRAYRRAQSIRGYLTDLIECLDEKMPQLEALESKALALHRRRCDFLTERRRADLSDQAQDVLALAARPGSTKPPESEEKIRRAAEREGRRRARRLAREAAAAAAGTTLRHRDGDSSDDDLPPAEAQHLKHEREVIREQCATLFSDALPAWRSVRGVCARLARWRRRDPDSYCDGYLPDCLPRLLAPYIRHQLVLWNPLADEDNDDYERMDWYKCLMMYGVMNERSSYGSDSSSSDDDADTEVRVSEGSVREDPDLMLVPNIINKVLIPKVTELVEVSWDPLCVRACIRLRQLALRLADTPGARDALRPLAAAVGARLAAAINADVFLPALPPQLVETAGGWFWRRCVGSGARLLRGALALTAPPALLHADSSVLHLIDTLCLAAGAAPPQLMSAAAAALAETVPRSHLRAAALKRIAALAQLALARLQTDNPLHLKALEQARAVIAEAKALE